MSIEGLGYVGVRAKSLEDWANFGTRFLGMQLVDKSAKSLALRMDDRRQRVVVSEDGGEGVGFFGWEVPRCGGARRHGRPTGEGRRAGGARVARARRGAPRQGPDRVRRSARQPARDFSRAGDRQRAVQAGPLDLRLPHRAARHGARGAARAEHQRRGAVLSRRARLPAVRLHDAAVQRLFLPRQSAPPLDRLHRDRAQRHASPDGRALQPRRCRPVLRPRADRPGEADRRHARPPHQRRGHLVLFQLAVGLHGRIRLGRPRHRCRQLAAGRGHLGAQHVGPRPHVADRPRTASRRATCASRPPPPGCAGRST